jgi:hypothetical protein
MTEMKTLKKCLAVVVFTLLFALPTHANTEYLYLTMSGDDMAPAICNGDTMKVKICTDGTLIEAGPANTTNPGDIIVYCAGAAVAYPKHMWMCGRAISKYFEDGHWYFKTKVDNSLESDPWEVPDYFLLGVVVEVTSNGNFQKSPLPSSTDSSVKLPNTLTIPLELATGIALGLFLGLAAKKAPSLCAYDEHSRSNLERLRMT